MQGVRVALSSGDVFWVDGTLEEVAVVLTGLASYGIPRNGAHLVRLGGRYVNPAQVAQLSVERDIPTIEIPERLEVPA